MRFEIGGPNESAISPLRQYLPKDLGLAPHSRRHLDDVASRTELSPKQTLGSSPPAVGLVLEVGLGLW